LMSLRRLSGLKQVPALIYVTHHIEEILPMFRRTLVLRHGRILYAGKTGDVLKPTVLQELYRAPMSLLKRGGRFWPVGQ
jgi:iron complex transport system ATP-binding protein